MKTKYVKPTARVHHITSQTLMSNVSSKATNDDEETISNIDIYTVGSTTVTGSENVW